MKREVFPVTIFQSKVNGNEILKQNLVQPVLDSIDELEIPEDWTTNKVLTSFDQEKDFIKKNKKSC